MSSSGLAGSCLGLVVGLYFSDEYERAPGYVRSGTPIVWMAAKVEGDNAAEVHRALEQDPPTNWYVGKRWYGERPNVWRPLAPLLQASTFEEQREALAAAVSVGRDWLAGAGAL